MKKHYLFLSVLFCTNELKFPVSTAISLRSSKRHSQKRGIQKGKSARNDNVSNGLLLNTTVSSTVILSAND